MQSLDLCFSVCFLFFWCVLICLALHASVYFLSPLCVCVFVWKVQTREEELSMFSILPSRPLLFVFCVQCVPVACSSLRVCAKSRHLLNLSVLFMCKQVWNTGQISIYKEIEYQALENITTLFLVCSQPSSIDGAT